MQISPAPADVHQAITKEEAQSFLREGSWAEEDDAPLKLVIQDAERAESAEANKNWVLAWTASQYLYESRYELRRWPGTQVEASSLNFFEVASAVNGVVPQVMNGLFYENPPFMIQERPGTTSQAARAVGALNAYQLEDINFREEIRLGVFNALLFGTAMWQFGWEKFTRERKIVKRKNPTAVIPSQIPGVPDVQLVDDENLEFEIVEEVIDRPTFEHVVNLREILVDPGLRVPDIRKAKYIVRRRYMTFSDLAKLRDRPGYDLPPKEEVLSWFMPPAEIADAAPIEMGGRTTMGDPRSEPRWETTTVDPLQQQLEVLERWDDNTYIVVLQKKKVIFNDKNPYGKIPFYSVGWWDIPDAFWSIGYGRSVGGFQRLVQGMANLLVDNANLNLNQPYTRLRGKNVMTQNERILPGRVIQVDDPNEFKPLERTQPVPEAQALMGVAFSKIEQISGANQITSVGQAGGAGHSNLARSAQGASMLGQGAMNMLGEFVDKLVNQVFVPFLYDMQELNKAELNPSQLKYILSDELQHEYVKNGGDTLDLLNARIKYSVLAGSKMQNLKSMAQGLPMMTQFLGNPEIVQGLAVEKKKVNVDELVRMWFEVSRWPNLNDVIVDMTPEDVQRLQQQSQGGAIQQKAQTQSQLLQQKFQQQQQLADNENIARAARDVLREGFKKAVEPEELTGQPQTSPVGFGGEA